MHSPPCKERRGAAATGAEHDADALARDEPLLALLTAASLRTRIASGRHRGEPWRRLGDRVEPREVEEVQSADPEAAARVPQHGGMSLHADVAVPARDRHRLKRLCRYVARPPLASRRLEACPDGTLSLRLKTRWRDGTTHILMERSELIERLVPLIPAPRTHQVRYHGILAPCASYRDQVVPGSRALGLDGETLDPVDASTDPPEATRAEDRAAAGEEDSRSQPDPRDRARRIRWASLLQRVFEVDALRCPRCGSTLRLIAAIEDPTAASKILECLELPARAPPPEPTTTDGPPAEPPGDDDFFDQSPVHDDPW